MHVRWLSIVVYLWKKFSRIEEYGNDKDTTDEEPYRCSKDQKRTLDALRLKKLNHIVEEDTPNLRGMIRKVRHLVTVVE